MKNLYQRQKWHRKDPIYESDCYCPSIENALFKQHKLEELLAENQLKKMGLQTAQMLIKALYEEVKRLQIQNFHFRTQIEEMYFQFEQKQKQYQNQISNLKRKINDKKRREKNFSQSKEYLSNILMPDVSRRLSVAANFDNGYANGLSPIKNMAMNETLSKQYVELVVEQRQQESSKFLYEQVRDCLMSEQLEKVIIDFQDITDWVRTQNEEISFLKRNCAEKQKQVDKIVIYQNQNHKQKNTASTKHNFSAESQHQNRTKGIYFTNDSNNIEINKRLAIKGKKLFCTENDNLTNNSPEKVVTFSNQHFQKEKINNYKELNNHNQKKENRKSGQKYHKKQKRGQKPEQISYAEIIKEYELIIQQYKQYSAYLRAYLCSCIGFINKQNEEFEEENLLYKAGKQFWESIDDSQLSLISEYDDFSNPKFPSKKLFNLISRDIVQTVSQKVCLQKQIRKSVQKQNIQLRFILDQLIKKLKQTGYVEFKSNNKSFHTTLTNKQKTNDEYLEMLA